MSGNVLTITPVNFDEVSAAFRDAPELARQFIGTELLRATARVRKRFIEQRLNGPPGIKGGVWKKQSKRHVKYWVAGKSLGAMQATIVISRFLGLHETGGKIEAYKKGRKALRIPIGDKFRLSTRGSFDDDGHIRGLIYIPRPGKSPILAEKVGDKIIPRFALVKSVTIKPRLGFKETVVREWPKEFPKIADAMYRAVSVALDRRMKAIGAVVQRVTSL